ncbi:hypothetical protein [Clostridium sp. Cult2]|uniref:hypothetical protein n=1 Tax=Clostridium sp. Cult2 TaxID=2079003 RepID=UPI001F3B0B7E|nr:hypothetical protein [Clostridium sp. Cult2]MCF6464709.1 hypothetical protein [Clostridium sp. Cult2]
MSIRPVDYTNIISKSQEVAKIRQVENDRVKVHAEQGVVQHEKQIEQNIKRVRDTNKSENLSIDVDKRRQPRNSKDKKERKKKDDKNKDNSKLGGNIDIKI